LRGKRRREKRRRGMRYVVGGMRFEVLGLVFISVILMVNDVNFY